MVIERNLLSCHHLKAGVPQGSPASPILFVRHTTGLIKLVEEGANATGLLFADHLRWVATVQDVNEVVRKLEAYAVESIEWAIMKATSSTLTRHKQHSAHAGEATRSTASQNSQPKS